MSIPERWRMYVDGFNFYYAVKHRPRQTPLYLGWCDFSRLGQQIIGDRGIIEQILYFTAPVAEFGGAGGELGGERVRQATWLRAVASIPRLKVVHGFHSGDRSLDVDTRRKSRNEKQTDVNIAVTLVRDAAMDLYDRAILVTGDYDQMPAVRVATKDFGRHVEVWLPPGQSVGRWKEFQPIRNVRVGQVTPEMLSSCRLPDSLRHKGVEIEAPPGWRSPS